MILLGIILIRSILKLVLILEGRVRENARIPHFVLHLLGTQMTIPICQEFAFCLILTPSNYNAPIVSVGLPPVFAALNMPATLLVITSLISLLQFMMKKNVRPFARMMTSVTSTHGLVMQTSYGGPPACSSKAAMTWTSSAPTVTVDLLPAQMAKA